MQIWSRGGRQILHSEQRRCCICRARKLAQQRVKLIRREMQHFELHAAQQSNIGKVWQNRRACGFTAEINNETSSYDTCMQTCMCQLLAMPAWHYAPKRKTKEAEDASGHEQFVMT